MGGQADIAFFRFGMKCRVISAVQECKVFFRWLPVADMIQDTDKLLVLLAIDMMELYGDEPCTLQCFGTEEIGGVIIRFQDFGLFRGYYGGELLQISDHQQLHTSEWFVVLPEFSHDMVNGI